LFSNVKCVLLSGKRIRCLDIGTGANAIYPLVGFSEYGWSFVGTDVDEQAIESAQKIVTANKMKIDNAIEFRLQKEPTDIFLGIMRGNDRFECSFCNPPFHRTKSEAVASSNRKWIGLNKKSQITNKVPTLNFGGQGTELVYEHGGEMGFLRKMIRQSSHYSVKNNVMWFTTLVSKDR
jgi:23S rRNA (adenine1618-N6)-methyltransferase